MIPRRLLRWVALTSLVPLLGGAECEHLGEVEQGPFEDPRCAARSDDATVGGRWVISGRGHRSECDEGHLNARELTMGSIALHIAQEAATGGLELASAPTVADGGFIWIRGAVDRACVSFATLDSGPRGTASYDFDGVVTAEGRIDGDWIGTGPGSCESGGTFTVRISR